MTTSLKDKSFQGLSWSLIESISGNGISFFIGIILARLLSPSDFGLIGMITIIFAIANTLVESGFSSGLIRKSVCTKEEYSTMFFFNIVISTLLYIILYFSAPYISLFFRQPQLISITRILGLIIIVDSLSIVQRVILIRNINFKNQTVISIASNVTSGLIGITMAIKGFGVWSLVSQILIRQTLYGLLMWIFSKWRPAFFFSLPILKDLFNFGSKLLISGLIVTVQNNIYYLIIGRYFTSASLGFYTRALQFSNVLSSTLLGSFERVTFPVLSSIQSDAQRFKSTLKRVIRSSFFISFLSLSTLAAVSKPLILILLGNKWEPSILYLQLVSLSSVFFALNAVNINVLKIIGRSDLILRLQLIKTLLILPNILAGIIFGIAAMLFVGFFTSLISFSLNSYFVGKHIDYTTKEQVIDIAPYLGSILLITLPMFILSLLHINLYLMITVQLFIGLLLFIIIFEKRQHEEYLDIKIFVLSKLSTLKK